MNTCNLNIPYILTANHSVSSLGESSISTWAFQFQYFSTTCVGNNGYREDILFNGSTLRARSGTTDFALVEMNQAPSPASGLFYAGWDRSGNASFGNRGIHHPKGDVMKIAYDGGLAVPQAYFPPGPLNYWRVNFDPNQGVIQPGSSGSPLFDLNHRIIGQCRGNSEFACGNDNACICAHEAIGYYGRFDLSWTGDGTNATRLSNWLDPTNSGVVTRNTTSVSNLNNFSNLIISGVSLLCSGTTQLSLNVPAGVTVNWTSSNTSIATVPPTGNPVTLTKVNAGKVTITATISFCSNVYTATKNIHMGGYSSVDYPFTSGPTSACKNTTIYFSVAPLANATNYTWSYPYDWTLPTGQGTPNFSIKTNNASGLIRVTVANACDPGGSPSTRYVSVNTSCGGSFMLSPNPANNELTITAVDENSTAKKIASETKIYQIKISDQLGNVKKQFNHSGGIMMTKIDISNLLPGIYNVQIYDGSEWKTQKLVKQ